MCTVVVVARKTQFSQTTSDGGVVEFPLWLT